MKIDNKWFRGCIPSQEGRIAGSIGRNGNSIHSNKASVSLCTSELSGKYLSESWQRNKANIST